MWMYCLGASTLAFVSVCIGRHGQDLKTCTKLGRIDNAPSALACGFLPALLGGLRVDSRQTHAPTPAPRAGERALRTTEV